MPIVRETVNATDAGGFISRVSWGSLFLGVVVALGVMLLLTLLGLAFGFSVINPTQEADPLAGVPIGTAIYFVIAHIIALAIGGYAAAKLASSAWSTAAVLHGAAVWALVSFLVLAAAVNGVGALISGTTSFISTVSGGAVQTAKTLIPNNVDLPDFRNIETLIPDDFISSLPPEIQQSLREKDLTLEDIQREGREALRQIISQQEQQRIKDAVVDTIAAIIRNPSQAAQEIEQLSNQLVGENGLISEQDRQQAMQVMQNRLGITPEEAEAIINQWQQQLQNAAQTLQSSLNDIQKKAAQVAEGVASAIASAAWWAFIVSLLGLLAAIGGAVAGRPDHRPH